MAQTQNPPSQMTSRDAIFQRIRDALTLPAPWLGGADHDPASRRGFPPHTHPASPDGQPRDWLPAVGPSFEERAALFAANAQNLKAVFHHCRDEHDALARLKETAARLGWKKIASHHNPFNDAAAAALGLPVLWTDGGYDTAELEACDAGITGCDALIAQTGSVLVTARSAGGRALSVLPPCHVVLARERDLLPDLPAAFDLLQSRYGSSPEGYPSFISFITGPSRTGDIERILVLGAHGPKELLIFLAP